MKQNFKRRVLLAIVFLLTFFLLQCQYVDKVMKDLNEVSSTKKDKDSGSNAETRKSSGSEANRNSISSSSSEVKKTRKEAK
jgi:hypothetical protein